MSGLDIVLCLLLLVTNVKKPAFMVKTPPTAELVEAKKAQAEAEKKAAVAEAELRKAELEKQTKKDQMANYTHQMTTAALLTAERIDPTQITPELKLMTQLVERADAGMVAYEGHLSAEQLAEMKKIVADSLSAVQAQRDAALKALAVKDADLTIALREKTLIEAKLPVLEATVKTEQAARDVIAAKHDSLEKLVTVYAAEKAQAEKQAGTLDALVVRLLWGAGIVAVILAGLYYVGHMALPSLAQENPNSAWLQKLNATVKSIISSHE